MPAVEHIIHKPEANTAYLNIGMPKIRFLNLARTFTLTHAAPTGGEILNTLNGGAK